MLQQFRNQTAAYIAQYGVSIVGVPGGPSNPTFAYTIGLSARFGVELFVSGLPIEYAHPILNDIAAKFDASLIGTPTDEFSNLPLLLKLCDKDLPRLHGEFVCQADAFYGREVEVVQVILSDREGRTPLNSEYDHEYMDKFQPLFVSFE